MANINIAQISIEGYNVKTSIGPLAPGTVAAKPAWQDRVGEMFGTAATSRLVEPAPRGRPPMVPFGDFVGSMSSDSFRLIADKSAPHNARRWKKFFSCVRNLVNVGGYVQSKQDKRLFFELGGLKRCASIIGHDIDSLYVAGSENNLPQVLNILDLEGALHLKRLGGNVCQINLISIANKLDSISIDLPPAAIQGLRS